MLENFAQPDEPIALGRFNTVDGETLYVGKQAITTEGYDLLVINWQADAAAPFFEARPGNSGIVAATRKYTTKRNTVIDFDELVFADIARRIEELTENESLGIDDALLRDLDAARDGEMRDIVQTIHATQYALVRAPLDQVLVIQGGPGTGKTAVALHRVSWLLYNYRDQLTPADVLVVGPNPTFTKYIKQVLPGLGDSEVIHRDLRSLGPQASNRRDEPHDTLTLKGDARMEVLLKAALEQRVRFPERTDRIQVGPDTTSPSISRFEVEEELPGLLLTGSYSSGRTGLRNWVTRLVSDRPGVSSAASIDAAVDRIWPALTAQSFLRDLLGSRERLLGAAGDLFTAGDVARLLRAPSERISDEQWSDADVALIDTAEYLINGPTTTYLHVVVDEAQDLSPMQLRSLQRRCPAGSFTIVGDLAQSTSPWARSDWSDVGDALRGDQPVSLEELELGYRVPRQIFDFAAQLLPFAAPTITRPRVVRDGPSEPELLQVESDRLAAATAVAAAHYAGRGLFVGIICPQNLHDAVSGALAADHMQWSDVGDGGLSRAINLVRPEDAKGLEFEAVVVVDPEGIVRETEHGVRMLYIAFTRTTKYLTVVHTGVHLPIPGLAPIIDTPTESPLTMVASAGAVEGRRGAQSEDGSEIDYNSIESEGPREALSERLARVVATELSEHIRASAAPQSWPKVIDLIRRDLDVSDEALFELFGE